METNPHTNTSEGKGIAVIAYITLIGLIIAILQNGEKKNAFSAYHIRQSLGLMCTGIALFILGLIPYIGWILSILGTLALIACWIMGILNAINEKEQAIPVVGSLYSKWFANI